MTSIDPTARLLGVLARRAREFESGRQRAAGDASFPSKPAGGRNTMQIALQAIAGIDPNDPQSPRLAFRAYLGAVLQNEFETIADAGELAALLDRVEAAMEADAALKQQMEQAGRQLLKRRG